MTGRVRVRFVDSATGDEVGRSDLPIERLPPTFDAGTTVDIGDSTWLVERAEPPQRAEVVAEGSLTLMLSRVVIADPGEILFSVPTINKTCPPSAATSGRSRVDLHEDDWRQLELVDRAHRAVVEEELAAIRGVFTAHSVRDPEGRLVGFRSLHVRAQLKTPLSLTRAAVAEVLPELEASMAVAIRGQLGVVDDSFAVGSGHLMMYGHGASAVTTLGLHLRRQPFQPPDGAAAPDLIGALGQLMGAHRLELVDWCRHAVTGPESLAEYLGALHR